MITVKFENGLTWLWFDYVDWTIDSIELLGNFNFGFDTFICGIATCTASNNQRIQVFLLLSSIIFFCSSISASSSPLHLSTSYDSNIEIPIDILLRKFRAFHFIYSRLHGMDALGSCFQITQDILMYLIFHKKNIIIVHWITDIKTKIHTI